jgi:hypothetical protein
MNKNAIGVFALALNSQIFFIERIFDKTNPFLESNNLNSFYIIPNII